jgi:hypothetical protein
LLLLFLGGSSRDEVFVEVSTRFTQEFLLIFSVDFSSSSIRSSSEIALKPQKPSAIEQHLSIFFVEKSRLFPVLNKFKE